MLTVNHESEMLR